MSISVHDLHDDSRLSFARRFGRDSRRAVTPIQHSLISNLARSSRRKV
jgi:hypothetical protein